MSVQQAPARRAPAASWVPRRRLASSPRPGLGDIAVVAVPALLAGALSAYGIGARSLGFDEAATVTIAEQHGRALWAAIAHDGGNMSGYYLLLHLVIGAFGDGLVVIRLASAAAATATAALVAAIGLRLFDRRVGLAAGVLCAVSLSLVYWAQNARGYAPMVTFVCGAFLSFVAVIDPAGERESSRGAWIALVVCLALGVYSSFVAVLVVPAQLLVVVLVRPRLLRRFAAAVVAVGLACLPLAVLALHRGSSQLFWVPRPDFMTETQSLQTITSAGMQPSFHRTPTTTGLMLATLALLVIVAAVVAWRAVRSGPRAEWAGLTVVSWLYVPVLLAWAASFVIQPIFVPRNLLVAVPPVALAVALPIAGWPLGLPRSLAIAGGRLWLPRALAVVAFAALVGLRGEQVVAAHGVSPEPWRQSVAYVMERARPGDCVAFYPEDARMAFRYYVGAGAARAPRPILPATPWRQVRPFVEDYATLTPPQIAARTRGCARLWLVSSHEGQVPHAPPAGRVNGRRFQLLRAALERTFGAAPVKQFGYAAAIHVQLLPGPARPR